MSSGTLLYDWSFHPKSHAGSWKEDRLISISNIERALSTPDGHYEITRVVAVVDDSDGIIRDLLNDEETAYWDGREAEVCLISDEALEAGTEATIIFRGIFDGPPVLGDERQVTFELVDLIGSHFSSFDLEKDLAIPIGDEHANLPEGTEAYYNIPYGPHTDVGSTDANLASATKGLVPGVYTGMYDVGGAVEPVPVTPTITPRPTNLKATVVGGGNKTYYYAASVITPFGESQISDVLKVTGCPDDSELGLTDYVKLSCDFEAGAGNVNKIRWWGRYTKPPTGWVDEGFYDYGAGTTQADKSYYNDGSHPAPNPTRADVDRVKKMALPKSSTAAISPVQDTVWGMVVVAIGEVTIQGTPLASDLAEEAAPKRAPMDSSLEGIEYLLPTSAAWPFPNPWIEKADSEGTVFRFTAVLMRGPRLQHHIDGAVTIAFNVCGYKGLNDLMIDQAFYQFQSVLNEFAVKDKGKGYRRGDFGPLETFNTGQVMLWTQKFQEAQEVSKLLTSNAVGFQGAFNINKPTTLRQFIEDFCRSFGARFGISRHGQPFPVLPYTTASLDTGRLYRYPYDIEGTPTSEPQDAQRFNRIYYSFDYDSDMGVYRVVDAMVQDIPSQVAHGTQGQKRIFEPNETYELFCTRYPDTAAAAMNNLVQCSRKSPIHTTLPELDLTAVHDELGDRVRYEHWNSQRPTSRTQLLVLRHRIVVDPNFPSIDLVGMDMNQVAP